MTLSRWHLHSHAQEIFRHCGPGSVKFRWVIGTNPAVSLPELHTVRKTLGKPGLILVVSDAFLTETDELADLVLPAALWSVKTGRQVAGQVGGRGRAFKAWARHTRGWFCDHSGLTYEKLSAGTGVHWPCNAHHPDGTERIDTDLRFKTAAAECETFGHDLETGAPVSPNQYAAHGPAGRAILKPAHYASLLEEPDREYTLFPTTGRVGSHFHTRTNTGRCADLNAVASEPFVEMHAADAERLKLADGDTVEVASRRGTLRLPVRVGDILPGHLFVPFHYGYWDAGGGGHHRAANVLTLTGWDPVSNQPSSKMAKGITEPCYRVHTL